MPASFHAPIIPGSPLPALLWIDTLRQHRGIIDTNTNRIYLLGSGTYDIESRLPRGTIFIQGETVPSGHLVIPSDGYEHEITGDGSDVAAGSETVMQTTVFPDHGGDIGISANTALSENVPDSQASPEAAEQQKLVSQRRECRWRNPIR